MYTIIIQDKFGNEIDCYWFDRPSQALAFVERHEERGERLEMWSLTDPMGRYMIQCGQEYI